mgnify:CR=1 FL=1
MSCLLWPLNALTRHGGREKKLAMRDALLTAHARVMIIAIQVSITDVNA